MKSIASVYPHTSVHRAKIRIPTDRCVVAYLPKDELGVRLGYGNKKANREASEVSAIGLWLIKKFSS